MAGFWSLDAIIVSQSHLKSYCCCCQFNFHRSALKNGSITCSSHQLGPLSYSKKETTNSFLLEHTDLDEDVWFCLQNIPLQVHFYHDLLGFLRVKRWRRFSELTRIYTLKKTSNSLSKSLLHVSTHFKW